MRIPSALLLSGALAVTATVSTPSLQGFVLLGGNLGVITSGNGYQRDVRIFNNSTDAASNDNQVPSAAHPGALGAAQAVWKAARAWVSDVPTAAKNFDFDWQGNATNNSDTNGNTVGWNQSCGGGTLAFTETQISNGWRIVMCTEHTWADGPGNPGGGQFDIQGVGAHELGHALGLGHSQSGSFCTGPCSSHATMCSFICSNGVTERDLAADDGNGLQAIYGAMPANKPKINSLGGSFQVGQTLVITGQNFAPTVNVKFTAETTQNTGSIPGVVFNVPSSGGGTQVSVTIPAAAKKGNVLVWQPAQGLLSNGFPIDIGSAPPAPPVITGISPSPVQAFAPGTVTVSGSGFVGATQLLHGGSPVGFTVVDANTITYVAPVPTSLGAVSVTVTTSLGTSNSGSLTYVETNPPVISAFNFALSNQPYVYSFGGPANDSYFLIVSTSSATVPFAGVDVLVQADLVIIGTLDVVGIGTTQFTIPPGLVGLIFHSQLVTWDGAALILASNILSTSIIF